jgi:hypothetical protein
MDSTTSLLRRARLEEFFRRLLAAPPVSNHEEAMQAMATILTAVEDEFSGIAYDPAETGTDGRLYPPKEQFRRPDSEWPGVRCYRQVAHKTFVAENGAIEIRALLRQGDAVVETVLLEKSGRDGRKVTDHEPHAGT